MCGYYKKNTALRLSYNKREILPLEAETLNSKGIQKWYLSSVTEP